SWPAGTIRSTWPDARSRWWCMAMPRAPRACATSWPTGCAAWAWSMPAPPRRWTATSATTSPTPPATRRWTATTPCWRKPATPPAPWSSACASCARASTRPAATWKCRARSSSAPGSYPVARALLLQQPMAAVPLLQRFLRESLQLHVVRPVRHQHPVGLRSQQPVHPFRRLRQRRVDGRGMRVHQVRPFRTEQPQRAAAAGAEMPPRGTYPAATIVLADLRLVHAQVLAPLHLERVGAGAEVDGTAAAAGGLAADRAVALQERRRRIGLAAETDIAAVAGTFQSHGIASLRNRSHPAG